MWPPVHVSVSTYLKALAKTGPQGLGDAATVDPKAIDWTSDQTTAAKPTEAQLRAFAETHTGR